MCEIARLGQRTFRVILIEIHNRNVNGIGEFVHRNFKLTNCNSFCDLALALPNSGVCEFTQKHIFVPHELKSPDLSTLTAILSLFTSVCNECVAIKLRRLGPMPAVDLEFVLKFEK